MEAGMDRSRRKQKLDDHGPPHRCDRDLGQTRFRMPLYGVLINLSTRELPVQRGFPRLVI